MSIFFDLFKLLGTFLFLGSSFFVLEMWFRRYTFSNEIRRKCIHLFFGLFVLFLPWIFTSIWPVLVLCVLFGIAIFIFRKYLRRQLTGLRSVYKVQRKSNGDFYYLISVLFLFVFARHQPFIYIVSLLILTISDSLAAIVGSKNNKKNKSIEGTMAFFLSSFFITYVCFLLFYDIFKFSSFLIGVIVAFFTSCIEAICTKGRDNLGIPIGCYLVLQQVTNVSLEEMQLLTLMLLGIVGWVIIVSYVTRRIHWRFNMLGMVLGGFLILWQGFFGFLGALVIGLSIVVIYLFYYFVFKIRSKLRYQ